MSPSFFFVSMLKQSPPFYNTVSNLKKLLQACTTTEMSTEENSKIKVEADKESINEEKLTITPIQQALHYVNDEMMKNDTLATAISDIILDYIFNINAPVIKPGMVLFGRCTQGTGGYQYNLIFLLTKMKNVKINPEVPCYYQSFDFDSIFIWPALSDSVSISSGKMELIDNGLFNQYKITATEHKYHPDTVGHQLGFGCKYNLTLKLPDYEDCEWSNWNEYIDRISMIGRWDWPYNTGDQASGLIYIYRIKKWDDQLNPKQYIKIAELKKTPFIKDKTTITTALEEIGEIVDNVKLNVIGEK